MMGENEERVYTDEEMREYNDEESMNLFLEDCEDFSDDINTLSTSLNAKNIDELNINSDINFLIEKIEELKNYKDKLNLFAENKKVVNEKIDKLKKDLVDLKNKHISIYNEKVKYINQRINDLTTKTVGVELDDTVKEMLGKLSTIDECEVFINGDWQQSEYLKSLDYGKLNEVYNNVADIEKKLKIHSDEPIELWVRWNYINESIKDIKKEITDDMSLSDINLLLNKCVSSFERIVDLDISHELTREELSKEVFSKYSSKISRLNSSLKNVELDLLERKNKVEKNPSDYTATSNYLEHYDKKYDVVSKKSSEYHGKCTEKVISRFNNYLNKFQTEIAKIKAQIEEYKKNNTLDSKQIENLDKKIDELNEKHKNVNSTVNFNPFMLKGVDDVSYFLSKMDNLDSLLTQLADRVKSFDGPVKDKDVRKEIDALIKVREKEIKHYNNSLLKFYKNTDSEKYNVLKTKLDAIKEKFDGTCKEWNGKHPLKIVGKIKDAGRFFKKHPKITLLAAGLATVALMHFVVGPIIIPAIMQGNIMMAAKLPALRSRIKFINGILGGIIGATKDVNGIWTMATGAIINPTTASTSLLKGLAMVSGNTALLFSPALVVAARKVIQKMSIKHNREETMKKKHEREINKKVNNEERLARKADNMAFNDLLELFGELFMRYRESGMLLDEFCSTNELSELEKSVLQKLDENAKDNVEILNKPKRKRKG